MNFPPNFPTLKNFLQEYWWFIQFSRIWTWMNISDMDFFNDGIDPFGNRHLHLTLTKVLHHFWPHLVPWTQTKVKSCNLSHKALGLIYHTHYKVNIAPPYHWQSILLECKWNYTLSCVMLSFPCSACFLSHETRAKNEKQCTPFFMYSGMPIPLHKWKNTI